MTPQGDGNRPQSVRTDVDLRGIEARVENCLEAVGREQQPMGRMMAWGLNGASIIRKDLPTLVQSIRERDQLIGELLAALHRIEHAASPDYSKDPADSANGCALIARAAIRKAEAR